jgi:hypothetical protein
MLSEEEYVDDEYIESENDPCAVEEVTEEDYAILDEEIVKEDEVVYSLDGMSESDMKNHDLIMEKKVLESLRGKQ